MAVKRRKVSLKDIAREAGVSTTAVSYVLNGRYKEYRIGEDLATRIRAIAKDMDYRPNGFARSLKSGSGRTIGVVVSDISNNFSSTLVKTIETTAETFGYMAIFSSSDEDASRLDRLVAELLGKEVDGLILVPCQGCSQTVLNVEKMACPLVLIDRFVPESEADYIGLDNESASRALSMKLYEQGRRKIGMILYDIDVSNMNERQSGYEKFSAEVGSSFVEIRRVDFENLKQSCTEAFDSLCESGCDAILCATYPIAINVFRRMNEKGLKLPQEISLATFDSGPTFEFFSSMVNYYSQPLEEMGRLAVKALLERIEGGTGERVFLRLNGTLNAADRDR